MKRFEKNNRQRIALRWRAVTLEGIPPWSSDLRGSSPNAGTRTASLRDCALCSSCPAGAQDIPCHSKMHIVEKDTSPKLDPIIPTRLPQDQVNDHRIQNKISTRKDCILKRAMHESSFPRRRISLRVNTLFLFNLNAIPCHFSAYEAWSLRRSSR